MSDHLTDFVLIHDPQWEEILNFSELLATTPNQPNPDQLQELINGNELNQLSQFCEDTGIIEPNTMIQAAKIAQLGEVDNPVRFWIVR